MVNYTVEFELCHYTNINILPIILESKHIKLSNITFIN